MLLSIYPQALVQKRALTEISKRTKQLTDAQADGTKKPLVYTFDENQFSWSEDFTQSAWSKTNATAAIITAYNPFSGNLNYAFGGGVSTIINPSDSIVIRGSSLFTNTAVIKDPLGNSTANQLSLTGAAYVSQQLSSVTAGSVYAISLMVKQALAGPIAQSIRISTQNGSWSTGYSVVFKLTSTWTRICYIGPLITSGTTATICIGAVDETGTQDSTCTGNVLVWGACSNASKVIANYVKTTATTLLRDNLRVKERKDIEGIPVVIKTPGSDRLKTLADSESIKF